MQTSTVQIRSANLGIDKCEILAEMKNIQGYYVLKAYRVIERIYLNIVLKDSGIYFEICGTVKGGL